MLGWIRWLWDWGGEAAPTNGGRSIPIPVSRASYAVAVSRASYSIPVSQSSYSIEVS